MALFGDSKDVTDFFNRMLEGAKKEAQSIGEAVLVAEKPELKAAAKTAVHVGLQVLLQAGEKLTKDAIDPFLKHARDALEAAVDAEIEKA